MEQGPAPKHTKGGTTMIINEKRLARALKSAGAVGFRLRVIGGRMELIGADWAARLQFDVMEEPPKLVLAALVEVLGYLPGSGDCISVTKREGRLGRPVYTRRRFLRGVQRLRERSLCGSALRGASSPAGRSAARSNPGPPRVWPGARLELEGLQRRRVPRYGLRDHQGP